MKNIFILALDDLQRQELNTIANADTYQFRSVLDVPSLVESEDIEFNKLLVRARQEISDLDVPVDAIIAHWDFPTSVLVPILCHEFGVPSPTLESILKCEHKLWSRMEQAEIVPEVVPKFTSFDPFAVSPLDQIDLDFPFWIKPIKTFSSQLGFLIKNEDDFNHAIEQIREKIGRLGNSFNEALEKVDLPSKLNGAGGNTCLAEEIIEGVQIAPEGSVFQGEVHIHGIFDMNKADSGTKLDRLEYPTSAPDELQQKMISICERLLKHIGFDNGCFNVEFMWDEQKQRLHLIEVNTRISQSHSEMFIKVDGMSNHEVAIDVALGRPPEMPYRKGKFKTAAKFLIMHDEDGIVKKVPSDEDIKLLLQRFPDARFRLEVTQEDRLSSLLNQDSYHFVLGELYIGADSREGLLNKYHECLEMLPFDIQSTDSNQREEIKHLSRKQA